ncbi:MAG: hypothetical protein A2431_00475 [Candidatus Zambryskibacteria bacterium RIFOXYC1_FULL_39_10]|uniref:GmrSD restriction endonucleases N-terminal domain-containing protein n=1 Tax=Candidatus Zambryskibacteria bacterium RIFOXYC1_FULL_39_10 TaxID=1802779 RepID=A0A1G2UZ68_9BACT|nr:MAG: hypothetical protein A2431_00475 [Candidatus Zambryskibacteria bacterium RIFOXYC1_FULL_39_10]OHB15620.1 MAG: hypothetical protein A2605_02335 [Candidatus Zambryskibacteria bacterium RIFOXYD1_FULL_39_35]
MKINQTTFPISWFRDRKIDGSLVLKPPYQRKPVWTNKQKAYLIDTILGGYNIPEIYMHRETDENGTTKYNIVDGQQRIRTILEFIDGEFSLLEEYTPNYADFIFKDLPSEAQKKFWGFTIFAREIVDVKEEDVKNLFRRMNKNVVTLNAQELRHATYDGTFIKLMEEEAEDAFWSENKIVTPNEIRRMTDVQFVSDIFVSMINGIQDKTIELDRYYQLYESEFADKSKWKDRFFTIKQNILEIVPDLKNTRWKNKSDFYTLFISLNSLINENKNIKKNKIPKLQIALKNFSNQISKAVQKTSKGKGLSKDIANYLNAVTKSTTDKDRRMTRHKIVLNILKKFYE